MKSLARTIPPPIEPIIKFNGGAGAILCNNCRKIIKENLTASERRGVTLLLFCSPECEEDYVYKNTFKYDQNANDGIPMISDSKPEVI